MKQLTAGKAFAISLFFQVENQIPPSLYCIENVLQSNKKKGDTFSGPCSAPSHLASFFFIGFK
jgi:hypothetical protein